MLKELRKNIDKELKEMRKIIYKENNKTNRDRNFKREQTDSRAEKDNN